MKFDVKLLYREKFHEIKALTKAKNALEKYFLKFFSILYLFSDMILINFLLLYSYLFVCK